MPKWMLLTSHLLIKINVQDSRCFFPDWYKMFVSLTFLPVLDQQNNKPHNARTTHELKDSGDLSCSAWAQPHFLIRALVISQIKYLMVAIQGIPGGRDFVQPF